MNNSADLWALSRDYLSLTKPRTLLLHIPIVAAALVLATGAFRFSPVVVSVVFGGGLLAASANTLNCYFDRDIDATMARTKNRPIPAKRLAAADAFRFGFVLGILGFTLLLFYAGLQAAVLALAGFFFYVVVYTLWLKRKTFYSSILGSLAGAMPPVVAWAALTGSITPVPVILGAIIVLWTPPHYWALALYRRNEYERSGILSLPSNYIKIWLMAFSCALMVATIIFGLVAQLGVIYYSMVLAAGLVLVFLVNRATKNVPGRAPLVLFGYSILYVVLVFSAIVLDRLIS